MASNLTLTPTVSQSSNGEAGVLTTVIYGTKQKALDAGGKYVYTSIAMSSPAAFQVIGYAGYKNIDAKYMAGNTNRFVINGYCIDGSGADEDTTVAANMLSLLGLNKAGTTWSLKIGSTTLTSVKKAIIMNIVGTGMGDGTGPRFNFTIEMQDLGK